MSRKKNLVQILAACEKSEFDKIVKVYLQELLGCSVDVVRMRESMNQLFKQQIQKHGVLVY